MSTRRNVTQTYTIIIKQPGNSHYNEPISDTIRTSHRALF